MKLKTLGRASLVTALSLAIGFGATACSRDYSVAYAYAISKGTGSISAYAVDYQTGALTQLSGSPFQGSNSGGTGAQPVVIVASPSGRNIYVVDNNFANISVYSVGTDGKLYGVATPNIIGSYPTSAAIDSAGCYLYLTVKLQPGYTTAAPGKGGLDIFPINNTGCAGATADDGSLRAGTLVPVGNNPISVAVSLPTGGNTYVYVVDQEGAPTQAQQPEPNTSSKFAPQVLGFTQNASTGALTLAPGSVCTTVATDPCTGYPAGTGPSAIGIDATARWAYVTDALSNQVYSYRITTGTGDLVGLPSSPTATGQYPINLTIDPRGKFLLIANYNSQTLSSFTINVADGSLGASSGSSGVVPASPTCIAIDPALGIYVYATSIVDGDIAGEKMNANTGQLSSIVNTPFPTSVLPSCITVVANGAHARSIVTP